MDYTNGQIDPPKIYCSICMCNAEPPKPLLWLCMHKHKATKTSDATFAQCKATKTSTATETNKTMCKHEDNSSKAT